MMDQLKLNGINNTIKTILISAKKFFFVSSTGLFLTYNSVAHDGVHVTLDGTVPVLATKSDLNFLNIPVFSHDPVSGVGLAFLTPEMQADLQSLSHAMGKCGGYEVLGSIEDKSSSIEKYLSDLNDLSEEFKKSEMQSRLPLRLMSVEKNADFEQAISLVQENNLRETVTWLSSFKNRINTDPNGNQHIIELKAKLENILKTSSIPWTVELISHNKTPQKSLMVRFIGKTYPGETVILGGHHDSINQSRWGAEKDTAPGADDNASGSANLLEVARILSEQTQPERTVEVFWYAGEESGLLGSAEIAKNYKDMKKDVIGVLQMDMTLFPGSGEMVITNISDFTNPWLRSYLNQINETYIGLKILDDKCGYGCSDHASWFRQGFPSVIPFEAMTNKMNKNIHTVRDVVSPSLSFKHSAAIAKLSLAFTLELANSRVRAP